MYTATVLRAAMHMNITLVNVFRRLRTSPIQRCTRRHASSSSLIILAEEMWWYIVPVFAHWPHTHAALVFPRCRRLCVQSICRCRRTLFSTPNRWNIVGKVWWSQLYGGCYSSNSIFLIEPCPLSWCQNCSSLYNALSLGNFTIQFLLADSLVYLECVEIGANYI